MIKEYLLPKATLDRQKLKFIFFWVFAFGLVAHGFCYFNGNFSHDSLCSIYEESPYMMISSGRYFRAIYRLVRGNFLLPALNGFLFLCFLSLSVYLLTNILDIQKKGFVVLTCGILATNSTVSLMNATYLHDADAYGFALLMAVLGVWVAVNCKGGILLSIPFYTVSLGIYQAFINVSIYLWLFLALLSLLDGASVKQVYGKTAVRMLSIAAAVVLYFIGHLVVLRVTGIIENGYYNTVTDTAKLDWVTLLGRVHSVLETETDWFLKPKSFHRWLIRLINLLLALASGWALVALGKRKKLTWAGGLGSLGILAVIPLGMNAIALVSGAYHDITIYSLFLSYPLMLTLLEQYARLPGSFRPAGIAQGICGILLGIMLFDNCLYSNTAYLKKELENQQTLSVFTRIIHRMEQTEGYVPGETPIVFVGAPTQSPLNTQREGFDYSAAGLWNSLAPSYYETTKKYISYYLGYPAVYGDGFDQWRISVSEEMLQMPLFPAPGSVGMIDGIMVIKFSPPIIPES
ncbi:MAG: glucosyltransferase domain-containing protein [Faecousia sp.]